MGFASSPTTRNALASHGIRVGGYRWRWALGLKGGTFPPHYHQNNEYASDAGDFEALPGDDVNGNSCMCNLVPQYRTPDGRFAKPGLTPVFQPPPVTAAMEVSRSWEPQPMDFTPLAEMIREFAQPQTVQVSIPQGAIVVNIPQQAPPNVRVDAAVVNVPTPTVNVSAPVVQVDAPTVNVAAPAVKVEPQITVQPARVTVKVIREKVAKAVRFRRNSNGLIESAEVTEDG